MKAGKCWLFAGLCAPLLAPLIGCAVQQQNELARALLVNRTPPNHREEIAAHYMVHCPDVLAIELKEPTSWKGFCPVGPDGQIRVLLNEPIRVEGLTTPEIAAALAKRAKVDPHAIHVSLAEYKSQQIYLIGEIQGDQRAVPYRGPETVLDLLQRVGGVSPGAAVGNIQVVRANVAAGTPPEVFQVDLEAILQKKNPETNIRLQPFDQIYIGHSRRHIFCSGIPPWLQPAFHYLTGIRTDAPANDGDKPAAPKSDK